MRNLTIAIALTLLCGCLGGKSGSSSASVLTIVVSNSSNVIVSASGPFDLIVSGTGATVTVAPNQRINNLTISGGSADVFIGSTSTVRRTVTLSGTSAVLHLPAGSPISVNTTGVNALVVYDSSAG